MTRATEPELTSQQNTPTDPHLERRLQYPAFATLLEHHTSVDGRFRDVLMLRCGWEPGINHRRLAIYIGAHPSTAFADENATINQVAAIMCRPGGDLLGWPVCNDLLVINLSPLRATRPEEAVASLNDPRALAESVSKNIVALSALDAAIQSINHPVIVWPGWGECLKHHTDALARPFVELLRGREVIALHLTKAGQPSHPCRSTLTGLRRTVLWPTLRESE